MKRYRISQLADTRKGHFLRSIIEGDFINKGRMTYKKPGEKTHQGHTHVHEEPEIFVILQGKGRIEVNGVLDGDPLEVGDVIVIEAGEDHHLVSDEEDPCILLWLHVGNERHVDQLPESTGA